MLVLSALEVTCLRWIAEEVEVREVAIIEGETFDEIGRQISRAMAKLHALTLEDAVEEARLLRLI